MGILSLYQLKLNVHYGGTGAMVHHSTYFFLFIINFQLAWKTFVPAIFKNRHYWLWTLGLATLVAVGFILGGLSEFLDNVGPAQFLGDILRATNWIAATHVVNSIFFFKEFGHRLYCSSRSVLSWFVPLFVVILFLGFLFFRKPVGSSLLAVAFVLAVIWSIVAIASGMLGCDLQYDYPIIIAALNGFL
eukprot:1351847-Amorphochlora_amoeboformis.AAC.2